MIHRRWYKPDPPRPFPSAEQQRRGRPHRLPLTMEDGWDSVLDNLIVTPPLSPQSSANEGRTLHQYLQSLNGREDNKPRATSSSARPDVVPPPALAKKSLKRRSSSRSRSHIPSLAAQPREKVSKPNEPSPFTWPASVKTVKILPAVRGPMTRCGSCSVTLRQDELSEHMLKCLTGDNMFHCGKCSARFSNRQKRRIHWRNGHGIQKGAPFPKLSK